VWRERVCQRAVLLLKLLDSTLEVLGLDGGVARAGVGSFICCGSPIRFG
jgi:hypothetical protein